MLFLAPLALALLLAPAPPAEFTPARLATGETPQVPVDSLGWAQATVEATVTPDGDVRSVKALSPDTPFLDNVTTVVRGWRFAPARVTDADGTRTAVDTQVLVVGLLRPPELVASTPAPLDVPGTSPEVPRPEKMAPPPYPPLSLGNGTVIVEVDVDERGAVSNAHVVRSAAGFDGAALDAARQWRFGPARRMGAPVPSVAYLVFGFREPIVTKKKDTGRP